MRVRTNALAAAAALLLGLSPEALAGQLGWVELQQDGIADVDGLDAVLSVAVSPDGAHVYAAGTVDDAVAVFERDLATGALGFVEVQKDGVAGVDGLRSASSVAVSPDGAHVYATGSNDHGIAVFERDVATGALDFVEAQEDGVGGVDGLRGAASVALSPDGSHVYVAGSRDYAVAVFERDPASGALGFVEVQQDGVGGVDGIAGAQSVAVSPDGAHVYVAGEVDHALAAFRRDATAGSLEFVEAEFDDVGGVDGLRGAWSVAVSPDGGQVYVAGRFDDSLAVFERDPATGTLGFVEVHEEGVAGVEGLEEVLSVAVSPEGAHVYTAAREGDAVAVFERDRATGTLSFAEVHVDGVAGVDGLWGAQAVAVSPDDAHVYAGAVFDDAVAVFATAVLDTVEVQHDGLGGVDGLDGARSVATSPDGAHVYVAG
nr:beta-propeller fold lactonase family protein [Myxococcota bacterium]